MSAPSHLIVDDFLDEDAWTDVWTLLQSVELMPVSRTAGAWKLDDGIPLGGDEIVTPPRDQELPDPGAKPGRFPSGTALDHVLAAVLAHADALAPLVGTDWAHVTARPYVYPAGSALSWHGDDSMVYTGAYVYYAHPHWNAHWGGELLLADTPADAELPIMGHRFEDESYSAALLEHGEGRFVMPKPNRLVVIGSSPHMVTPVRAAAGSNVRASISGFFLREPIDGDA
ncbi:MAG: 2OG-Fe(II) oxygenase [Planctomycetota bacterium]|nr:2OG-Fe(II) oxygenase [Planctomycetota bacterium]